jgi:hypothetical protein
MSEKEWIELMSVTAQVFLAGYRLTSDEEWAISDYRWHCLAGKDLSDPNVLGLDGKLLADVTTIDVSFPASCGYARHAWDEFSYVEYEHVNNGGLVGEALEDLVTIAKGLLARCEVSDNHSVRFLVAWRVTLDPGGWYGDMFCEPENDATLLGWVNLTKEGMTIVPVAECAKMEAPVRVAKPVKQSPDEIPF